MVVDFSKRAISFYNKNGLVFFNKFEALNSRMKTVRLQMTKEEPMTTIMIENPKGRELGTFDININKRNSTIEGKLLVSYDEKEGNAELMTLAAIMELAKNKMNRLTYTSGERNVPFLAKLGFIIDTDDSRYIMRGLKQIMRSRIPNIDELKRKSAFWYPKLHDLGNSMPEDKSIFAFSCKVLSDYIKLISRYKYPSRCYPFFGVGANMRFSSFELQTEQTFLNKLTEKHCIDYKF